MDNKCIDKYRVVFSCKLVTLAASYDKMICMNLDTTKILSDIILARNLLTTLCIIRDSNCYDLTVAEKIVQQINKTLK